MDIDPIKARQGRNGKQVLTVLLISLVLGIIAWVTIDIYGYTLPSGEESLLDGAQSPPVKEPAKPL